MDATNLPSIRQLADWMLQNGVGLALIAIVLVLLFVYFMRLIFKKPPTEKIEDIYLLVVEIKIKLEELMGRKE